ncbi:hypothetical protein HYPSUDRAFT_209599 [Hypholoma sublateritium FD-334 SS-4]|uniref:Uncharacterized protein n=1 Tax=Hypholoma sublateritium (strain FD-334 SS-4) TaxID=945553 RepID=A0A0D2NY15_HYPSF|nr:hypothetical protein HYPSUDRAFT_209599 [Hypholoma sublateritium FD-334 SS-4]
MIASSVMDTAKALVDELPEKRNSLSKCLYINEQSLPAIIDVLKYWSTPLSKTPRKLIQSNSSSDSYANVMANIASLVGPDPQQQKLKAASMRNRKAGGDIYGDLEAEKTIYKCMWALIPPQSLLPRHPALAKLAKQYMSASDSLYGIATISLTANLSRWYLPKHFEPSSASKCRSRLDRKNSNNL